MSIMENIGQAADWMKEIPLRRDIELRWNIRYSIKEDDMHHVAKTSGRRIIIM